MEEEIKEEPKKKTTRKRSTKQPAQSVSEPVKTAESKPSGITYQVAPGVRIN